MKQSKLASILGPLAAILVGVLLLVFPGNALATAVTVAGIALLLVGAVGAVLFAVEKENRSAPRLIAAIIEILVGIVFLAAPGFIISLLPVVAGVLIVLSGVMNLANALRRKSAIGLGWKLPLILAVISILLGVLILCNPFETMTTLVVILGVVLIYNGVAGLVSALEK